MARPTGLVPDQYKAVFEVGRETMVLEKQSIGFGIVNGGCADGRVEN